jgi:RNA polymerase sigma-70 factor (ECF subfamily)
VLARIFTMKLPHTQTLRERQLSLYEAIQAGEPGWEKQAYDEYFPLVRGLIVKSLGPSVDVEDFVADVFVGFFESAKNIRTADAVRSYIVSIAMNVARRERRRLKRRRISFFTEESSSVVERVPSVDDPKAKAALLQLHGILDTLGTEEQLVFVLHVLQGLPLVETATSLGTSLSTVKRRLKRANERVLRKVKKNPLLADYVLEREDEPARGPQSVSPQAVAPQSGSPQSGSSQPGGRDG